MSKHASGALTEKTVRMLKFVFQLFVSFSELEFLGLRGEN